MTSVLLRKFHQFHKIKIPTSNKIFQLQRLYSTCKRKNVYLIDEDDSKSTDEYKNTNKYVSRTHSCGELRPEHVGQKVSLCGWLEYQRMNKFLVLRDSYGETQILLRENDDSSRQLLQKLSYESIIQIKGTVLPRPEDMINKNQKTGEIEVLAEDMEVLNKAKPSLPFNIREFQKAKEPLRMQYRYLDLRFPQMQRNLRVRSQFFMKMREYLVNMADFVDVETPTLFKATPGGAQEFIVPTRFPGEFYSLVQSPQQFKQMLMAGGIDSDGCTSQNRNATLVNTFVNLAAQHNIVLTQKCLFKDHSQMEVDSMRATIERQIRNPKINLPPDYAYYCQKIARCYRDETARSDRQPEFTQLDIEMSFTNIDGVIQLVEDLLCYSWPEFLKPLPNKFPRKTYYEALEEYGTDKPDISFDFKLQNCTELLKVNDKFSSLQKPFGAYCIVFPKPYVNLDKKIKENINRLAKKFTNAKLVQSKITNHKEWCKKMDKLLTEMLALKFVDVMNVPNDCVLFLSYGNKDEVLSLLGEVRLEYVNYLEDLGINIRNKEMNILWIVDFPLFEFDQETKQLKSVHHPFTAPKSDNLHLLETSPLQVKALSYDLVLNGHEIGGGSIRIHDPNLQEKVFQFLSIDKTSMQHILDMLASGCPPHGGIALGLDRLLSVILKTTSIRDVIAFPKNFEGRDPLSGAPSPISEEIQKLYNVKVTK